MTLDESVFNGFCLELGKVYDCKVIDCKLTRMPHDNKLRLEVFVYDQGDHSRIDASPWDKVVINKVETLRNLFKEEVRANRRLQHHFGYLNVKSEELDDLFVIVSAFVPCLRWDLNINLDKEIERQFFRHYLGSDDFEILKEFELLVLLVSAENKKRIEDDQLLAKIANGYTNLLIAASSLKEIFNERPVQLFVEEQSYFKSTFGNLRNYLN